MKNKSERDDDELNKSDSDDWTLVSPPESANSSSMNQDQEENSQQQSQPISPTIVRNKEVAKKLRRELLKQGNRGHKDAGEEEDERASGSQDADDEGDDGLVEIDLNAEEEAKNTREKHNSSASNRPRKSGKVVEFVDSGPIIVHQHQLTQAKTRDCSTNTQVQTCVMASTTTDGLQQQQQQQQQSLAPARLDEPRLGRRRSHLSRSEWNRSSLEMLLILGFTSAMICFLATQNQFARESRARDNLKNFFESLVAANNKSEPINILSVHPHDTAYSVLKRLDRELERCVREFGFGWLDENGKIVMPKPGSQAERVAHKFKPFKGGACYERESKWRKEFKKLKDEYNIDLRKLVRQGHNRVTASLLQALSPTLRFSYVINQIEYLTYLDEIQRNQEIERLKAENLELKKRLASRHNYHHHHHQTGGDKIASGPLGPVMLEYESKSLARLESENGKLKREIDGLKASLSEKAGTVYIKQSLELEKCERENNALRQFHHQVAHEVSKALKLLDLQTIDAAALLNDHESLSSQLALTRTYLLRLGEEISRLVSKNKNAEEESEFYRLLLDTLESTPRPRQIEHNEPPMQVSDPVSTIPQSKSFNDEHEIAPMLSPNQGRFDEIEESKPSENKSAPSCMAERNSHVPMGDQQQHLAITSGTDSPRANWLMRRAKLRERLRKSSGIDIIERQIDRLIDESKHLYNGKKTKPDFRLNHNSHDKETFYHKKHSHKHEDTHYVNRHSSSKERGENKKYHNNRHQHHQTYHQTRAKETTQQDRAYLLKQLEAEIASFRDEL